jgi:hypothetical protein
MHGQHANIVWCILIFQNMGREEVYVRIQKIEVY